MSNVQIDSRNMKFSLSSSDLGYHRFLELSIVKIYSKKPALDTKETGFIISKVLMAFQYFNFVGVNRYYYK